jgi:GTPase SAR1 family protein
MILVYFVGTAGSGKSTLTGSFQEWCNRHGYDAITVNLDPGVLNLPYKPEVDVREWILLEEVMKEYNLGPNGAQVVCADILALNAKEVEERINEYSADYILVDTPGQLELFIFRSTGKVIVEKLNEEKSLLGYIIEPSLATTHTNFISQLMLSATTQFRLMIPLVNILSKRDLIDKKALEMILKWGAEPDILYENMLEMSSSMHHQFSEGILSILKEMETHTNLIPISSETLEGMDDLYTYIQSLFMGGEDLERR